MPEFILEGHREPAFTELDDFTQGFIEALFFTECEPGTNAETHDPETQSSLHGECGFLDLAPEALDKIKRECEAFQRLYKAYLEDAYATGYEPIQAGRDFWFSNQGHGVGYWDRDLGELGEQLHDFAKRVREPYVYLGDDGKVYLS